jgi:hypothetical protein
MLLAYGADEYWDDVLNSMSGRVPYLVETTKATPVPNIASSTLSGAGCSFRAGGPDENWWKNWKDHLFYALAENFKPTSARPLPITCDSGCLRVNGVGGQIAVVMFAGKRLTGQVRSDDAARGSIGNYLEGRNLSNHPNAAGNSNYEQIPASAVFNDALWCISLSGGAPVASPCP